MELTLKRVSRRADGIFGVLLDGDLPFALSLEHAFDDGAGGWKAIIPAGDYVCQRGTHQLSNAQPFTTYEVMGVAGHSGLVFHKGNINQDTRGCVIVGEAFQIWSDGSCSVQQSGVAFDEFMARAAGVTEFPLHVVEV